MRPIPNPQDRSSVATARLTLALTPSAGLNLKRNLGLSLALALSWFAAGCSEAGPARQPVSGTITLDGKPLTLGTITFAPLDGTTAATAPIQDGAYRLSRSEGPAPGRYQVEISAVQPTGKRIAHPDLPSETIDEVRNIVPPNYNVQTELAVEIKPDGDQTLPFELSTPKRGARSSRRSDRQGLKTRLANATSR